MLGRLVETKQIEPHIPVRDKSDRSDGTISSSEFVWDEAADEYRCPKGRSLHREWRPFSNPRTHITKAHTIIYRSRATDCASCPLKARCCPNTQFRKIPRNVYEVARNVARGVRETRRYRRSRRDRKKVEMLFAHLKRILRLDRLRLRGLSAAPMTSSYSPRQHRTCGAWRDTSRHRHASCLPHPLSPGKRQKGEKKQANTTTLRQLKSTDPTRDLRQGL